MRKIILVFLFFLLGTSLISCAATYKPPTIVLENVVKVIQGSKSDLFKATKQILIMEGYQILNSDEESGTISTAPKLMRLDESYCDCGTTMGLPYIKDKRTITKVSVGLLISDNKINAKTTIEGEYLKADVVQSIAMVCISTGKIESELMKKIKAQL